MTTKTKNPYEQVSAYSADGKPLISKGQTWLIKSTGELFTVLYILVPMDTEDDEEILARTRVRINYGGTLGYIYASQVWKECERV